MTAKSKTSTRKTTTSPTTITLRVNEADLEAYRGRSRTIRKNVNTFRSKLLPGSKVTTARGENGGRVRSCSRRVTCAAVMVVPAALPLEQKRRNTDKTINIVQDDTHQGVQEPSGKVSKTSVSVRRVRSHLRGSARAYFEKSVEQGAESSFLDVSLTTKCPSCGTQQVDRAPSGKDEKKREEGAPTESHTADAEQMAVTRVPETKTEEASSDVGQGQAPEASAAPGPAKQGLEASTASGPAAPGLGASAASSTALKAPGSQNSGPATETTQAGKSGDLQSGSADQSSSTMQLNHGGPSVCTQELKDSVFSSKEEHGKCQDLEDALQDLQHRVPPASEEAVIVSAESIKNGFNGWREQLSAGELRTRVAQTFPRVWKYFTRPDLFSAQHFGKPDAVRRALTEAVFDTLWESVATKSVKLYTKEHPECAVELVRAHLLFGSQLVSGCFEAHPKAYWFVNRSRDFLGTIAQALNEESAEHVNVARQKMLQLLKRAPTEGENSLDKIVKDARGVLQSRILRDDNAKAQAKRDAEEKKILQAAEVEWKQLQYKSVWTGPRSDNELKKLLRSEDPLLLFQADRESILKIFKGEEPIVNFSMHLLPSVLRYNPLRGGLKPGILIDAGQCSVLAVASYDTGSNYLDPGQSAKRRYSHVREQYTEWQNAAYKSLHDPQEITCRPAFFGTPRVITVPADQKVADHNWNSFISEPKNADRLWWRDTNQREKAKESRPQERFTFLPKDATKEIAVGDLKKIAEHINSWPAWERLCAKQQRGYREGMRCQGGSRHFHRARRQRDANRIGKLAERGQDKKNVERSHVDVSAGGCSSETLILRGQSPPEETVRASNRAAEQTPDDSSRSGRCGQKCRVTSWYSQKNRIRNQQSCKREV
ncbi:unnamed protein product [Amoebophrya sp. A25]|nr:unnamed protein product [Amoebophrya sp. A25]|eukprot:GSA25T00004695001.1